MHVSNLRLFFPQHSRMSKAAGHGCGGSSPSRTLAYVHEDYPAVPDNPAWLEKYGEAIDARFGGAVKFAERFSVPVRIHLARVRCF